MVGRRSRPAGAPALPLAALKGGAFRWSREDSNLDSSPVDLPRECSFLWRAPRARAPSRPEWRVGVRVPISPRDHLKAPDAAYLATPEPLHYLPSSFGPVFVPLRETGLLTVPRSAIGRRRSPAGTCQNRTLRQGGAGNQLHPLFTPLLDVLGDLRFQPFGLPRPRLEDLTALGAPPHPYRRAGLPAPPVRPVAATRLPGLPLPAMPCSPARLTAPPRATKAVGRPWEADSRLLRLP